MVHARSARPDVALKKALAAEDSVAEILRGAPQIRAVFTGKIIVDPDRLIGSGEVDICIVTDNAIVALEVKNWASDIVQQGDDIRQKRLLEKGVNSSIIPKIRQKSEHLKRHLIHETNEGTLWVDHLVVLANEYGNPSKEVLSMRHVSDTHSLLGKIEALTSNCEPLRQHIIEKIVRALESMAEYDEIHFDGGQLLRGHIVKSPEDWPRSNHSSVTIKPKGLIYSLFRGLKLRACATCWDGKSVETVVEDSSVSIRIPWKKGNKTKSIKLSSIKEIKFGSPRLEKPSLFNHQSRKATPLSNTHMEMLEEIRNPSNKGYAVGDVLKARKIVAHLGENDSIHSILVELKPKSRPGILNVSSLGPMNYSQFHGFYAVGQTMNVRIKEIQNDNIKLIESNEME